jgi:signal transduction histidine kinase
MMYPYYLIVLTTPFVGARPPILGAVGLPSKVSPRPPFQASWGSGIVSATIDAAVARASRVRVGLSRSTVPAQWRWPVLQYSPQGRAERLIAGGRVVLAASALIAVWLDPSPSARGEATAFAVLSAYVGYAAILAGLAWRTAPPPPGLRLATHVVDLGVFALVMYLAEEPTGPFFMLFVFSIAAATLRWGWPGTLWTGSTILLLFVAMGVYAASSGRGPRFELNLFIIRGMYLAAVATLLGYLGAYERRLRGEMARLAAWPATAPREGAGLIGETLAHAAATMDAPRALLVWEDPEEPWRHVAAWSRDGLQWTREAPGTFEPVVAPALEPVDFLCAAVAAPTPWVFVLGPEGSHQWVGAPLHGDLVARFGIVSVLGLRLRGEAVRGRLLVLDKPRPTSDDLVLGEVVAHQVTARMDQFRLMERLGAASETDARIRLARDLHDGLLQALTAAALQIEAARNLMATDSAAAVERLHEVQRLLSAEQRDLRTLLRDLKPTGAPAPETTLRGRLEELRRRVERQWGLRVTLEADETLGRLPRELAQDVRLMVHEALVNAARHGRAKTVEVRAAARDGHVRLVVVDDGRGFSFRGRREHGALSAGSGGPVSLWSRVDALGGTLTIDSSERGVHLEIVLPLERASLSRAR